MICSSCGDETGANYCSSCGASTAPVQEEGPKGIGVGGSVILLSTAFALLAFYIGTHPRLDLHLQLPSWIDLRWSGTAPAAPDAQPQPVIVAPTPAAPVVPRDPYEELSSTRVQLHGVTQLDLRLRLSPGKSAEDVDALLRSRVKDLRDEVDVVELRLYPVGAEGLAADQPLVTYTTIKPGVDAPDPRRSGATEVEPGVYRLVGA